MADERQDGRGQVVDPQLLNADVLRRGVEPLLENARNRIDVAVFQRRRIERTDAELDDAYEAEDEDKVHALEKRRDALMAQLSGIDASLNTYAPDVLSVWERWS